MSIFSEIESKIFKNEEALSAEYLPEMLPHREQQIKQLARNLSPTSQGRRPQNTFIFGPPGTGKTAVTKFVLREFEEYSDRVNCIYINCWNFRTAVALLSKIVTDLGFFVQRRGWSKDEIIQKLTESMTKLNKSLVVSLDEVDQLQLDALYDLLRINQYVKNPVGLIFISNDPHIFMRAEPRVRSSLATENLEFLTYNLNEMKDILMERAKYAFHSFDSSSVLLCANHAIKNGGDVRIGLQCLLKAGRVAEEENANKLGVEHVRKTLNEVKKIKPEILKEKINETEKIIVEILDDGKLWLSSDLYKRYCELANKPMTDRSFRSFVNHLEQIKLIKVRKKRVKGNKIISKA